MSNSCQKFLILQKHKDEMITLMPSRNFPDGFFQAGLSVRTLPLRPKRESFVVPSTETLSGVTRAPIATSPLPLQSMISITFGFPSEVLLRPIAPGSTFGCVSNIEEVRLTAMNCNH
jgi:hypothetical protein